MGAFLKNGGTSGSGEKRHHTISFVSSALSGVVHSSQKTMATLLAFGYFPENAVQTFVDAKCINEDQELINNEIWRHDADFDVCVFDEDKMMTHILDCYAALCSFQQYRRGREQSNKLDAKTQQAKNKAFRVAMSLMSRGLTNDDAKLPHDTSSLSKFAKAFPDDTKQTDGRGWMPLHWATLALGTPDADLHGLSEEDVKLIYAIDPLALQRFHNDTIMYDYGRYTPMHFLCMQPVTPMTMSLLRYFSICNQQALISSVYDGFSLLHAACDLGQPTEELLQHLLQLDSSQVTKKCSTMDYTPLQYLCQNDCCNESLMSCLLQFDSSAAVVGGAIQICFYSADYSSTLEKVDFLLKVNPEAAQHHSDSSQCNLLHSAIISYPCPETLSTLCIDIMKRILAVHPDAVKEVNAAGELPVHTAAKCSSLEVMEFLLGLYPESAAIDTVRFSENLLHLAVSSRSTATVAKVRYLCSRYPELIQQRNNNGKIPLHTTLGFFYSPNVSAAKLLCEAGGQELVKVPTVSQIVTTNSQNGWLPLHFMIKSSVFGLPCPLSEEAGFFRLMLRWYPEAAGIEAGTGSMKKTPYQLALDCSNPDPYYLRLLLRAAPNLNPAELHQLNYAERRMAMFMAFKAITTGITPLLIARLRFENKDLVKHVVSFL